MSIKEYLPLYLQEIKEFDEICKTEDIEVENLTSKINELLNEIIVDYASNTGLSRYEKIYNIKNISTDIEERRFNILNKMNGKGPFTLNWLNNKLKALVGEDNYKIDVDYNKYRIDISVSGIFQNIAETLNIDLKEQLPANLIITVNLFQTEKANIYVGTLIREGDFMKLRGGN